MDPTPVWLQEVMPQMSTSDRECTKLHFRTLEKKGFIRRTAAASRMQSRSWSTMNTFSLRVNRTVRSVEKNLLSAVGA